jgi:hypothetical protein
MANDAKFWKTICSKFSISQPLEQASSKKRIQNPDRDFWNATGLPWKDSYGYIRCDFVLILQYLDYYSLSMWWQEH